MDSTYPILETLGDFVDKAGKLSFEYIVPRRLEDTSPEIRQLVRQIVMARPEAARFLMWAEMHESGKELAKIGMPGGLTPVEQKHYLYRRIHGEDFPVQGS